MEERNNQNQPRKENGNRISVRPGNFNPPQQAKPAGQAKPAQNGGEQGAHSAGHSRNRRRGHRGHGGKDPRREQEKNVQEKNSVQQKAENARPQNGGNRGNEQGNRKNEENNRQGGGASRANEQGGGRSRNRRGRRGGKGEHRQNERAAQETSALSLSLQRELDEEFGTPTLGSSNLLTREKKRTEEVLDSEEFAVDIATASYLVEDVPCGFPVPDGKAVEVVGVRFRDAGRIYFFAPEGMRFRIGEHVIVDTARGPELGDVVMLNRNIAEKDVIQPLRSVLRRATPEDVERDTQNKDLEKEALHVCEKKIAAHKLDMHLVDAQYTFDNSKLLFYFTSEGRVDFRELVHDLASHFHTRIELRQIGIRDEARLIGGLGMCGRPFCCSTFLSDFGQVSVKMAKEQGLSINASKISGCCGRLMCCLRYEHETYQAEIKLTPRKDTPVQTPDGEGVVVDSTPLAGTVRVRLNATPEEPLKTYHRDDLTVLQKGGARAAEKEAPEKDAE